MAYTLMAVIGAGDILADEAIGGGVATSLGQELSLIPLVAVDDELRETFGQISDDEMRCGFSQPPPSIVPRLIELSKRGAVAFVEAEYWAGEGEQACVVWQGGRIVLGPLRADDAINQALRLLGVSSGSARDEFDAVGLGRHRNTHAWSSQAKNR